MDEQSLSQKEIDLMLRALGWSPSGQVNGQRNFYVADPGSDEDEIWKGLCDRGMANLTSGPTRLISGNNYNVTNLGGQLLVLYRFQIKVPDIIDEDADTVVVEISTY